MLFRFRPDSGGAPLINIYKGFKKGGGNGKAEKRGIRPDLKVTPKKVQSSIPPLNSPLIFTTEIEIMLKYKRAFGAGGGD